MCHIPTIKSGKIKSEKQTEASGLTLNATIAASRIAKRNHTSKEKVATSVAENVIQNIAKKSCLLMNKTHGKVVSRKLLKLAEETKNIRNGNVRFLNVMDINVFGVEEVKGWKLTTSRGGVQTQNFAMKPITAEHSV